VMRDAAVSRRLTQDGATPLTSTPDEYAADIAAELLKWGTVVRESGAHVD